MADHCADTPKSHSREPAALHMMGDVDISRVGSVATLMGTVSVVYE